MRIPKFGRKRKKAELFTVQEITFVREQSGQAETEFKAEIIPILESFPKLNRAFLAQIKYANLDELHVALCLRGEKEEKSLIDKVTQVFIKMFSSENELDFIFIDCKQEKILLEKCIPFWESKEFLPQPFYLSSSEILGLEDPRICIPLRRLYGNLRKDYLLVKVDPPIPGTRYQLGNEDLAYLILATRHSGTSLFPIEDWPVFVHVARWLIQDKGQLYVDPKDLDGFAWAELYKSEKEARLKKL